MFGGGASIRINFKKIFFDIFQHRQQPLVFFCQYCQHAICRECVRKHKDCKIDRIDNVSNKQIKMMEVKKFF